MSSIDDTIERAEHRMQELAFQESIEDDARARLKLARKRLAIAEQLTELHRRRTIAAEQKAARAKTRRGSDYKRMREIAEQQNEKLRRIRG